MAYNDYGAFVWRNGERRPDKEDVGVFDTDEANLPSVMRVYRNTVKNWQNKNTDWWNNSHHGVMGDGSIRVACYKQGLPTVYRWVDGKSQPVSLDAEFFQDITGRKIDEIEYHPVIFEYHGHVQA